MSTNSKFAVLVIEHKHGIDAWVCDSEKTADDVLTKWALDWWDSEIPDEPHPREFNEIAEVYFERVAGYESYGVFYPVALTTAENIGVAFPALRHK